MQLIYTGNTSLDRNLNILQTLATLARDLHPVANCRIMAAIYYKNKLISYGCNQMKSHPFQAQFSKNEEAIYWHAETNAVYNALRVCDENDLKRMTLYVARTRHPEDGSRNQWIWGNSRPCEGCMSCLDKYKIKQIVYTLDDIGEYGVINAKI